METQGWAKRVEGRLWTRALGSLIIRQTPLSTVCLSAQHGAVQDLLDGCHGLYTEYKVSEEWYKVPWSRGSPKLSLGLILAHLFQLNSAY